ncbi:MAG: hypothetical protein HY321_00335 [Armatimonadetes bacterium]|nr:hypothetical protein [Armatimonadota bacterium]
MKKLHIGTVIVAAAVGLLSPAPAARAAPACLPLGLRIWAGPSFVTSEGHQWLIGLHQASRDLIADSSIGVDFGLEFVTGSGKDDVISTTVSFERLLSGCWRLSAGTGVAMAEGGKFSIPLTAGVGYRLHRRVDLIARWYSLPADTRSRTHAAQLLVAVW